MTRITVFNLALSESDNKSLAKAKDVALLAQLLEPTLHRLQLPSQTSIYAASPVGALATLSAKVQWVSTGRLGSWVPSGAQTNDKEVATCGSGAVLGGVTIGETVPRRRRRTRIISTARAGMARGDSFLANETACTRH